MGSIGKIIGGTLGWTFGGPLGAILGAAIGHNLHDKSTAMNKPGNNKQAAAFVGIFSLLGKMAKADGTIINKEVNEVKKFINDNLKLNSKESEMAMKIFYEAEKAQYSYQDYANQLVDIFSQDKQMLKNILDILLKIAAADKHLHEKEEKMLKKIAKIFDISMDEYQNMESFYNFDSNINKYYEVLNCKKGDSMDKVKSNYRKLVKDYHPDKIMSKDLPKEFEDFAHEKFKKIQEAYEKIKKNN
ncbi:MAG: TerB family tellurite resistance protein [Fusobacteriota bacterium]